MPQSKELIVYRFQGIYVQPVYLKNTLFITIYFSEAKTVILHLRPLV